MILISFIDQNNDTQSIYSVFLNNLFSKGHKLLQIIVNKWHLLLISFPRHLATLFVKHDELNKKSLIQKILTNLAIEQDQQVYHPLIIVNFPIKLQYHPLEFVRNRFQETGSSLEKLLRLLIVTLS